MAGRRFRTGHVLRLVTAVVCGWVGVQAQTLSSKATALYLPGGVAYDAAGNLFIADTLKHEVIEMSLAGVQTVVAGTGEQGFAGDGGAATAAMLNAPSSVAVGTDGTLYVADAGNQRIRIVVAGQINTAAGNGSAGYGGDGADARLAMLRSPMGLAVDGAGGLLIADSGNHRIRRLAGGKITTVAGTGVQGFGGDGAAAALALLDTPMGVAASVDGRVFLADSHNHRIRVIGADGIIRTFAGSGVRGFSGDGGTATAAALFLPRGVAVTATGDVWFADADNHRLRAVSTSGVITTLAGDGVQGSSLDSVIADAASLDSPRGAAVSSFGLPVLSDPRNHVVQAIASDEALYALAPGPARASSVSLSSSGTTTYGQGAVAVAVQSAAPASLGAVTLLDGSTAVATASLAKAATMLPVDMLSAGQHMLTATFTGDGLHAAAVSGPIALTVAPSAVTAAASPATVVYGSATPVLTGTLKGVLARDEGKVAATFSSSAGDLAPVGTYPILASLTGTASGNYVLASGGSLGGLQVVPAGVRVALSAPAVSYAGLPITLSASLTPESRGVPTGTVSFLDNGVVIATASASGGVASTVYVSPATGAHSLSATYGGDHNFLAASSSAASVTVGAIPDFALSVAGNSSQTVQGGAVAAFALQVVSQASPFSGAVSFSVVGAPNGFSASFSPSSVVPGSSAAGVTMSVQTRALASSTWPWLWSNAPEMVMLLAAPLAWSHRRRVRGCASLGILMLVGMCGCGARTVGMARTGQTFPLTVTGTSTNLAGAVVSHSLVVNLTVE